MEGRFEGVCGQKVDSDENDAATDDTGAAVNETDASVYALSLSDDKTW